MLHFHFMFTAYPQGFGYGNIICSFVQFALKKGGKYLKVQI